MDKNFKLLVTGAACVMLGIAIGIGFYGKFGIYSSSEECILANIENAKTANAASFIAQSCRGMYPAQRK